MAKSDKNIERNEKMMVYQDKMMADHDIERMKASDNDSRSYNQLK